MPDWVNQGTHDYTKRLSDGIQVKLVEIPLIKRNKASDLNRILEKEALIIVENIPNNCHLIALDVYGKEFNSEEMATRITQLQNVSSHFCFIIGGPEGLSPDVLNRCHERWSLSKLTLPHPLARIVLVEALYRAWSIINNHPYHK
ncbi:rRNA large subunit methyltransferase [Legionella waltersii]|uniref:Ribosomal RNA large subunit methyltransferase H n=2 Tax=Legionella waltersii TaxID=66969 RepID=A0A0W1ALX7_9GAMM|nr:rRNA large subunit methyltransferase [Legionella waltersii]SNV04037.1 rRNA large subunit methyltransferase [Legionella waltersii]